MCLRRLATASILCGSLLLLTGCAQTDSRGDPQPTSSAATAAAGANVSTADGPPSQTALEGIPIEEMTHQPLSVQMTQCLTQHAKWIDLPAGKTSPELHTRLAAHEQELLFLLPNEVGGFDNIDVAAGPGPRGTVSVSVIRSADGGADPIAIWQALRDSSPEVEAAAAGIEAEGASFTAKLVDFSYATLCEANLAVMSLWGSNDDGLLSARMDVELNRIILTIESGVFSDSYREQLLATAPDGVFEFKEAE